MIVISVVTIAVVASASTMVPLFRSGVENLGRDVSAILSTGSVGGVGGNGYTYNGGPNNSNVYNGGTSNGTGATREDMSGAMNDMVPAAGTQGNDPPDIGSPFLG